MKAVTLLAVCLFVSSAFGQALKNVPPLKGMYISSDGTGNPGTWVPESGTGTSVLPNRVPDPVGAYCSNDGTGNPGTWVPCPATNSTTASCLAATTVTTPCTAFQGAFTALGVSGTTGVQTLYTTNAPANATFQICPTVTVNTAGSAGNAVLQVSFTTPGGTSRATSSFESVSLTTAGNQLGSCVSVAIGANSSFSFAVLAVGGTGTPVWETEPVVLRIH